MKKTIVLLLSAMASPLLVAGEPHTYTEKGMISPHPEVVTRIISIPEPDTDKDGVIDRLDQCPGTPVEYQVNTDGCHLVEQQLAAIELDILFDNDSSEIQPGYKNEFRRLIEFVEHYPEAQIEIGGHTSSLASAAYNQLLSERRAQAVLDMLREEYGFENERLVAKGYGESQLKDLADTDEAHEANRRIEVVAYGIQYRAVLRTEQ